MQLEFARAHPSRVLCIAAKPSCCRSPSPAHLLQGSYANLAMNGQEVFKFAVRAVPTVRVPCLCHGMLPAFVMVCCLLERAAAMAGGLDLWLLQHGVKWRSLRSAAAVGAASESWASVRSSAAC